MHASITVKTAREMALTPHRLTGRGDTCRTTADNALWRWDKVAELWVKAR